MRVGGLSRRVDRQFYLNQGTRSLVDVVAIPGSELRRSPYSHVEFLQKQDVDVETGRLKTDPITLALPGRYAVVFDFDGPRSSVTGLRTMTSDGELLGYQEAKLMHLKMHACSHMIFEIDRACQITCDLRVWEGEPAEFCFRKVGVSRIVLSSQS